MNKLLLLPHEQYSTVAKSAVLFRDDRASLQNDPRSFHPITEFIKANITIVKQLINQYPHIIYAELEKESLLSYGIHPHTSDHIRYFAAEKDHIVNPIIWQTRNGLQGTTIQYVVFNIW